MTHVCSLCLWILHSVNYFWNNQPKVSHLCMYSLYIYCSYLVILWKKASTLGACFEPLSPLSARLRCWIHLRPQTRSTYWVRPSEWCCKPEKHDPQLLGFCGNLGSWEVFFFQGCRWIKYHLYDEYVYRCILIYRCIWIYIYICIWILSCIYIYVSICIWWMRKQDLQWIYPRITSFYPGDSHSGSWGVQQITRPSWNQSLRLRRTFQGNAWLELEIVQVSASKLSNSYWKYPLVN